MTRRNVDTGIFVITVLKSNADSLAPEAQQCSGLKVCAQPLMIQCMISAKVRVDCHLAAVALSLSSGRPAAQSVALLQLPGAGKVRCELAQR